MLHNLLNFNVELHALSAAKAPLPSTGGTEYHDVLNQALYALQKLIHTYNKIVCVHTYTHIVLVCSRDSPNKTVLMLLYIKLISMTIRLKKVNLI